MATFAGAYAESQKDTFRKKCLGAMTQVALDVGGEATGPTNWNQRQAFSVEFLRNAPRYLDAVALAVALGDVTDASPDTGVGSFYERCSAIFDDFAGRPAQ